MTACSENGGQLVNSYALVAYVPDPLRTFLDDLRRELVPACIPNAHITILPPRPLLVGPEAAWRQICLRVAEFPCFIIQPREVEIFDVIPVIYIAIGAGFPQLQRLHHCLNTDSLEFPEVFPYCPHITLAQELAPEQITEVWELARRRWAECPVKQPFPVETVTFVQNTSRNEWIDLVDCRLGESSR
jgi:2'-5' RNA ligase